MLHSHIFTTPAIADETRRERLLRFIEPWARVRRKYRLRCGDDQISHSHLTTDALEMLAGQIAHDLWAEKRRSRLNRAAVARRELYAEAAE